MESSYNMMEEDRQFDLRDILASMLLGWKLILCCILAGMLLLGFVGIKKLLTRTIWQMYPMLKK